MAEFQIYDFRCIDQPLTAKEKAKVENLSSHIDVNSRRAVVSYSYGSFKHDEEKVLEEFFDALLYQTSYGQKKLMFRFPKDSVNYNELFAYCIDGGEYTGYTTEIRAWKSDNYVLLLVEYCDEESDGWIEEGDDSLDDLLALRTEIINGDFSCLYAFWLKILSLREEDEDYDEDDYDEDEIEELPNLPLGFAKPSMALKSFIEYFDIDEKLVKAAASFAKPSTKSEPNYDALLSQLNDKEKTDWLTRLLKGEALLEVKLKKQLAQTETEEEGVAVTFEQIMNKALGVKKK